MCQIELNLHEAVYSICPCHAWLQKSQRYHCTVTLEALDHEEAGEEYNPHDERGDDTTVIPGLRLATPLQRQSKANQRYQQKDETRDIQLQDNLLPRRRSGLDV